MDAQDLDYLGSDELDDLLGMDDDDDDLIGEDSPWIPTLGQNLTNHKFDTKWIWVIYDRVPNQPCPILVVHATWLIITHWAPAPLVDSEEPTPPPAKKNLPTPPILYNKDGF